MTQFALCVPAQDSFEDDLATRAIIDDESWLLKPALELLPPGAPVRVPIFPGNRAVHDVFTEAHNALFNRADIRLTTFCSALAQMLSRCRVLLLWWGDDWSDLPVVANEAAAVAQIVSQLKDPIGEVYLRWEQPEVIDRRIK